jgi:hypothetical protein
MESDEMNVFKVWYSIEEEDRDGDFVDKHEDTSVGPFYTLEEASAAGDLIAAAPALLDAVRDLLLLIDDAKLLKTYDGPLYPVVGSARAAIEAAGG